MCRRTSDEEHRSCEQRKVEHRSASCRAQATCKSKEWRTICTTKAMHYVAQASPADTTLHHAFTGLRRSKRQSCKSDVSDSNLKPHVLLLILSVKCQQQQDFLSSHLAGKVRSVLVACPYFVALCPKSV